MPFAESKHKKDPNYDAISDEVALEVAEIERKHRAKAMSLVSETLFESVETLVNIMRHSPEEIRKEASAKHILKLGGMEVEKVEHGGKVAFEPFVISRGDHEK